MRVWSSNSSTPLPKTSLQTAPYENRAVVNKFVVTHPFHPLRGQEFDFVERRNGWLDDRFFYYGDGYLKSLPACWTSVVSSEEVGTPNKLEAYFRTKNLLDLYELIVGMDRMVIGDRDGEGGD